MDYAYACHVLDGKMNSVGWALDARSWTSELDLPWIVQWRMGRGCRRSPTAVVGAKDDGRVDGVGRSCCLGGVDRGRRSEVALLDLRWTASPPRSGWRWVGLDRCYSASSDGFIARGRRWTREGVAATPSVVAHRPLQLAIRNRLGRRSRQPGEEGGALKFGASSCAAFDAPAVGIFAI
ncbi:hypothetical protein ACLOJK_029799 [Asimina triloba]